MDMRLRRSIPGLCGMVLAAGLLLWPAAAMAEDQTGQLKALAKQAHSEGHLDREAELLCQAAGLDPKGFTKRCDNAKAQSNAKLAEFEADFGEAKSAISHLDFAGALVTLEKITYGPHQSEASRLLGVIKAVQASGGPAVVSQRALRQAQTMFQNGNFPAALEATKLVLLPSLQPAAREIVAKVQLYQATMTSADQLASAGHPAEAAEKYRSAMSIAANGPGNPASGLQRMMALVEQQKQAALLAATSAAKQKDLLDHAHQAERSGDLLGALAAYNAVLALDGNQSDAKAGRAKVQASLARGQLVADQKLTRGIQTYYDGNFQAAAEAIAAYLELARTRNRGAAQFYLGASLASQYLVSDTTTDGDSAGALQRSAAEHFRLARKAGYRPVSAMVSPRVLDAWKQATEGNPQ